MVLESGNVVERDALGIGGSRQDPEVAVQSVDGQEEEARDGAAQDARQRTSGSRCMLGYFRRNRRRTVFQTVRYPAVRVMIQFRRQSHGDAVDCRDTVDSVNAVDNFDAVDSVDAVDISNAADCDDAVDIVSMPSIADGAVSGVDKVEGANVVCDTLSVVTT